MTDRYWLTPPDIEDEIERILGTRDWFDPCPYPLPDGWDALNMTWSKPWYLNPPFRKQDGGGPTKFIRKAIAEKGPGVIIYPVTGATFELVKCGILSSMRPIGRVRWLECDTKDPYEGHPPGLCVLVYLSA